MRVCKTGLRSLSTEKLCQQLRVIALLLLVTKGTSQLLSNSGQSSDRHHQSSQKWTVDAHFQSGQNLLLPFHNWLLVKMFKVLQLPIFLLLLPESLSLENGLARTPPMGELIVIVIITSSTISVIHLVYQYGDQNDCTKLTC